MRKVISYTPILEDIGRQEEEKTRALQAINLVTASVLTYAPLLFGYSSASFAASCLLVIGVVFLLEVDLWCIKRRIKSGAFGSLKHEGEAIRKHSLMP